MSCSLTSATRAILLDVDGMLESLRSAFLRTPRGEGPPAAVPHALGRRTPALTSGGDETILVYRRAGRWVSPAIRSSGTHVSQDSNDVLTMA